MMDEYSFVVTELSTTIVEVHGTNEKQPTGQLAVNR